jgi:nucleoside-diphosphate-sugar epimerase
MKILVYGSKGWIGNQFVQILKEKNMFRVDIYTILKLFQSPVE